MVVIEAEAGHLVGELYERRGSLVVKEGCACACAQELLDAGRVAPLSCCVDFEGGQWGVDRLGMRSVNLRGVSPSEACIEVSAPLSSSVLSTCGFGFCDWQTARSGVSPIQPTFVNALTSKPWSISIFRQSDFPPAAAQFRASGLPLMSALSA